MTTFTELAIQKAKERQEKYQEEADERERERLAKLEQMTRDYFFKIGLPKPEIVTGNAAILDGVNFIYHEGKYSGDWRITASLNAWVETCPKCGAPLQSYPIENLEDVGDFLLGSVQSHTCPDYDEIETPL